MSRLYFSGFVVFALLGCHTDEQKNVLCESQSECTLSNDFQAGLKANEMIVDFNHESGTHHDEWLSLNPLPEGFNGQGLLFDGLNYPGSMAALIVKADGLMPNQSYSITVHVEVLGSEDKHCDSSFTSLHLTNVLIAGASSSQIKAVESRIDLFGYEHEDLKWGLSNDNGTLNGLNYYTVGEDHYYGGGYTCPSENQWRSIPNEVYENYPITGETNSNGELYVPLIFIARSANHPVYLSGYSITFQ